METHVRILGILNLVLGGLGTLGALAVLVLFGGIAGFVGVTGGMHEAARIAAPILGFIGVVLTFLILALSLPCLIVGYGLLNYRPWARLIGIVVSALNILNVPLGTALGVYGLWVLLNPETERLFNIRR